MSFNGDFPENDSSGHRSENNAGPHKMPDDLLPPVVAPNAGFLLQLFLIPLVIVLIVVMVWLMFSWLAHMGSNPRDLVKDLSRLNDSSWQKALTLADMLRNPQYDHLKYDAQMASQLAALLDAQIEAGSTDEKPIKLRIFLCRALGEFRVPEVVPVLVKAGSVERTADEVDVRRAALEALAVYAQNVGPQQVRHDQDLLEMLRQASSERSPAGEGDNRRAELRSTAAYVLGVIGGDQALDRLVRILDDPYANARYNAATGLARQGDLRAKPVLLEMLDPQNEESWEGEQHESEQEFKRTLVTMNGIRATTLLAEKNPEGELADLREALTTLAQSQMPQGVRLKAQEALHRLEAGHND